MTVESSVQYVDGKDLIGLANYALLCLRQNPFVSSVKEITPTFIFDLAVILFGSEHRKFQFGILIKSVPFPVPVSPLHDLANFEAIVNTLSKEIGVQLDHINPEDLMLGRRRTVSHMVEILAAFIGHCLEEDLLDFDAIPNSISSDAAEIHSNDDTCHSMKSLEYPDFQLCISPELPRLSSVRTVCPTSSLRQSCHLLESSQSNAQLVVNTPVTSSSTEVMTSSTVGHIDCLISKSDLNFLENRTDYELPNYPLIHRIHPSILSMQPDTSPPATPKAMNELVEITHSKSPEFNAPSLKCSPVSQASFSNKYELHRQSLGLVSADVAPNNCIRLLEIDPVSKEVRSEDIPLMEVKPKVLNSTERDLLSSNSPKLPTDIKHSHKYKNDSSSSGRGHSATNTPTSHCLSSSTLPPSWTESLGFGDMNCFPKNVDVSLEKSDEHNRNSQYHCPQIDKSISSSNSESTESILAWQQNVSYEENQPLDTFNDLASVLSTSLVSDIDTKTDYCTAWPPASVLLNSTEKFIRVFKRRLDYLRNISMRAHTEAQTLYRLVQLLSSQNADVVRSINDQIVDICKTNLNCAHETNMKRIEDLLQNILMNVNTLMKHAESDRFNSHKYDKKNHQKLSTKSNEIKHKRSIYCSNNNDLDIEFDKLMNLKHKCMIKGLSLCLKQLQPTKSVPILSYVKNSKQTLIT